MSMTKGVIPKHIVDFAKIAEAEQSTEFQVMVFKAQVVRVTLTRQGKSNAVELRINAETIDEILAAENTPNYTLWCDKNVPLNFGEGDVVWCVANKYINKEGKMSLKGFGFWVERTSFPQTKPVLLTPENTKAAPEQKDWSEKA